MTFAVEKKARRVISQIVFEDLGRVAVAEATPPPAPGPGEVLLAPAYVGICGTDLHVLHGKHPWVRPPLVTGHEVVGRVTATGPGVTRLKSGDAVVLDPLVPCGHCRRCRLGAVNTCAEAKVIGFRLPGAAQTRIVVAETQLHPVPDSLALNEACLIEPVAVGVHAADRANDLEDVLVIGGGTIGLCVLLGLKARGAGRVTVIEPSAAKRELAIRLGAGSAVAPGDVPAEPAFTAVFDCVATQGTADLAAAAALTGGTVVMVGVPSGPLAFPIPRMQRFEIDLHGSGMYGPGDITRAIALVASGEIGVAPLITAIHSLHDAPAAYARAEQSDSVKVLIAMS